jgi:hydrogenase maturation factor
VVIHVGYVIQKMTESVPLFAWQINDKLLAIEDNEGLIAIIYHT